MTSVIRPARHRYPDAVRQDLVEEVHGLPVPDPYRWLEDAEATQARRWGEEQDALYEARRTALPGLERWRAEVAALADIAPAMTPKVRGDRVFRLRQDGGREHPVLMVKEGEEGTERVLLDPSALDPSGRTVLDAWQPSLEGDLLAFQVSLGGTEDSLLRVIDVATGTVVDGPVDRMRKSSIGWLPGGGAFYYVRQLDPRLNPGEGRYHRRVYLHRVGSAPDTDALVFGEGRDRTQFYSVSVTADGRWLGVTATLGTGRGTDLYLADLSAAPLDRPLLRPVQEGREAVTRLCAVPGTGPDDPVWLRTDRGAPRGHVVACRPADLHLGPGAWREVIAERPDAILTHLVALSGPELPHPLGLAAWTRRTVAEVTVHDLVDGRQLATVPLPGTGAVGDFSAGPHGSHDAWFTYTDFVTPPRVLHFDARTCRVTPWEPGAQDAGTVGGAVTRQVDFPSGDGTTVRMFVISPTGRPDVPRPTLLTGYGGFGGTMSPRYRAQVLAWVRAGGVFAWAGLRGGGEEGEQWHRAGSGEHKQNTFDDFDAATDHLVSAGWADGRIAIMGGSNGGLLVGAALTQHPEKYAAVVCMSPLLDMVRYELSGLGPSWVPEYGSARDPARLRTLLGYSPYHRVTPGTAYPAVLLTASDGDTRTDPLHARKMCAALQHASSGPGPVLLRLERGVGHGDRAASRVVALQAECLAFLAAHVGLAAPVPDDEVR
ncbi:MULTISPECIES: prolyl oligopeptidase family serine peptidase [Streptomyces]|uniref:prolyl oligopeptidase n=3 Tax=Streptomyces TaxID=1883 RepID=A0ABS4V3M1_9ACTN|nr:MULTISPECIES: prolyl oligopeptidase family serine peptidase [Streptomyces]MBP2358403.1 prolyl oligopeptidase [Streptomyces clavifer]MDX2741942.1 prolyl oligopeptidase family serine peptidase [Streptomyces sp. NRRL_B-2557]GHA90638.1 prolyl endopeptidase [Streptomyces clavifer]